MVEVHLFRSAHCALVKHDRDEHHLALIYFFRRGDSRLTCETRLNPLGAGYELVVIADGPTRVEPFDELSALLAREHELLQAWRATGWREAPAPGNTSAVAVSEDWLGRR